MACQSSPTATLFGTSVVSTISVSSSVSTELVLITSDSIVAVTTCAPTVVASTTTCVPKTITSLVGTVVTSSIFHTTLVSVPVVSTITNPTQTLFGTSCDSNNNNTPTPRTRPDNPTATITTTASPDDPNTPTPTPRTTSSSSTSFLPPVTLTHTFTSTDPNGVVVVATSETVSTPTADSNSTGSSSTSTNLPAIIGGVVGGVVGLIALIGIIWFIIYKKRSGSWDDIWEEDEGHQAGAAEAKRGRPAVDNDGSSPNHYAYGVVGRGTPSPLLRGDQHSTIHSHSRSASTATGYVDHGRSNSQTPLMLATSPYHSPPTSPPSLQPPQLPGALERTRTPVWASPSAQQGYFQQGYPPIPSDPNFTPTLTSTYSTTSRTTSATASSAHGLLSSYAPPAHTAGNPPPVSYPPGAAPPVIGGRRSTYSDHKPPLEQGRRSAYNDYKPPLEQSLQGVNRPPSSQQTRPSTSSTTHLMDAPVDNAAEFHPVASGLPPVHTPSIRDRRYDEGGLAVVNSVPTGTAEPPRRTSPVAIAQDAGRAASPAPIVEEAPPAYEQ